MKIRFGLLVVVALLVGAMSVEPAEAGTIDRLQHRLLELPLQATPFPIVKRLVLSLGRLEPRKAPVWYWQGLSKLIRPGETGNTNAIELGRKLYGVVKRSDLSDSYKQKITRQITAALLNYTTPVTGR